MIQKIGAFTAMLFSAFSFAQNTFPTSGSVGIGTTAPTSFLEIKAPPATTPPSVDGRFLSFKNNNGTERLSYTASVTTSSQEGLFLNSSSGGSLFSFITNSPFSSPYMYLAGSRFLLGGDPYQTANYKMFVNGISRFTQNTFFDDRVMLTGAPVVSDGSGRFIIPTFPTTSGGVSVANYKLFVKGGILTEEIRVALATTWADYVFQKDYQLPTLEAVEKHIQDKGHLINVPSADEIATNGINLGEMSKIQQEKIEELTLYIIAQNKINDKQAQILEKQNSEIEALKALVKTIARKNKESLTVKRK
jgi:hypothetical protein